MVALSARLPAKVKRGKSHNDSYPTFLKQGDTLPLSYLPHPKPLLACPPSFLAVFHAPFYASRLQKIDNILRKELTTEGS